MHGLAATAANKPQPATAGPTGFGAALSRGMQQINAAEGNAVKVGNAFQAGQSGVPLYKVMLATQKASMSLQFGVQVRNGLVSAYNDVMNMQI
ncbi:MAG TPA: flagellar hook-basal body complex protein FliE [Nevskiaceae bacterium]|nr:flagellar hook-basal body complex protein FliE [Nevskiaceae bacterium]